MTPETAAAAPASLPAPAGPPSPVSPLAPVGLPAPDAAEGPEALRLVSVLVSGLPVELGTADEPARYTVPAVFSRQVTAEERARIEDPATARRLAPHADPELALEVSDRRLLIKNTNLAELRDGLAAALAARLRDIDRELGDERAQVVADAAARHAGEVDREAIVAAAVAQVRFE